MLDKTRKALEILATEKKVKTSTETYLESLGVSSRPLVFLSGRTVRKNRNKLVG